MRSENEARRERDRLYTKLVELRHKRRTTANQLAELHRVEGRMLAIEWLLGEFSPALGRGEAVERSGE